MFEQLDDLEKLILLRATFTRRKALNQSVQIFLSTMVKSNKTELARNGSDDDIFRVIHESVILQRLGENLIKGVEVPEPLKDMIPPTRLEKILMESMKKHTA